MAREYEFSDTQNDTIRGLAKAMQFVGTTLLVLSLMIAGTGLYSITQGNWTGAVLPALAFLLAFTIGLLCTRSSIEFRAIVISPGRDISHLMIALNSLRKTYLLISVMIGVAIFLVIVIVPFR